MEKSAWPCARSFAPLLGGRAIEGFLVGRRRIVVGVIAGVSIPIAVVLAVLDSVGDDTEQARVHACHPFPEERRRMRGCSSRERLR